MGIEVINRGLEAIEKALIDVVVSEVDVLHDASAHILTSGGKRIRPQMALLAYLAAGGSEIDAVIPVAAAVEMVHTATLVHDDINDHSLTRRGKATIHSIWGRTFALLTGDYLFTKVYQLMAPYGAAHNIIMADACSKLVEGETLQAAAAKAGTIDRETYKRIIALKTASLFEAAARMGSLLATDDKVIVDALASYAYNLGLTFQIVDDILDIIGDPEEMGKPVGSDILQGRGVVVAQGSNGLREHGGDGVATPVLSNAEVAVAEPVQTAELDPFQQMMANLRESGAVEIARHQAHEMAARARTALEPIPPSTARDELYNLIDLVLDRQQ